MRPWHALHAAYLRWLIQADEAWIRTCQADGIGASLDLSGCQRRLGDLRVRLALIERKAQGFRTF
jgi:hypothetical protein